MLNPVEYVQNICKRIVEIIEPGDFYDKMFPVLTYRREIKKVIGLLTLNLKKMKTKTELY